MRLLNLFKPKVRDASVCDRAARVLAEIDQAALPALIRTIRESTDSKVRISAIEKLSQIDDAIVPKVFLVALLKFAGERDTAIAIANAKKNLKGKAAAYNQKTKDVPMVAVIQDITKELLAARTTQRKKWENLLSS